MSSEDSGIALIRLGDLVTFTGGYSFKSSDWKESGVPVLKIANVRNGEVTLDGCSFVNLEVADQTTNYAVTKGDLLMTLTGEIGAMGFYQHSLESRLNQRLCKVEVKDPSKVSIEYIHFFLTSPNARQTMWAMSKGAAQANISVKDIATLQLPLPPLEEQKRIVEQLDVQLYKLEKSRESLLKLKLLLKSLSRSLLHHNVSGHGDLYSLSELCTLITDGSHFSPKTVERGFPYITVRDLQDSGIDFENCKYINEDSFLELERSGCSPKPGDVLFSKDGTVGKVALVSSTEPFVVLSSIAILRPNSSLITPEFLKLSLRSPQVLEQALGMKSGTAIRRVVLRTLKTLEIAVPSLDEQRSLVKFVDAELSKLGSLDNQIEELIAQHENLRRSLLHAAFAGQLTKEN
jgi:type I restriction enzyme S subunit